MSVPGTVVEQVPDAVRRADTGNLEARMVAQGALHCAVFSMGDCNVIVAREPAAADGTYLWHLSISAPGRYPTWDEIKTARYRLLPDDICCCMFLPEPEFYVDVVSPLDGSNSTVFHVWEVNDSRRQWEAM